MEVVVALHVLFRHNRGLDSAGSIQVCVSVLGLHKCSVSPWWCATGCWHSSIAPRIVYFIGILLKAYDFIGIFMKNTVLMGSMCDITVLIGILLKAHHLIGIIIIPYRFHWQYV